MSNFALLNNVDHQDLKVITDRGPEFGDAVMSALVFPFEFRSVQAEYPILFQEDKDGNLYPIALFGFEQNENLLLSDRGWEARYIPAMMRRDPFLIGYQEQQTDQGTEKIRVLSIDLDHPRISREAGESLFQPLGGNTPFLDEVADLLEQIFAGLDHCRAFTETLSKHGLVEDANIEITLKDGTRNQLIGFKTLTEDKVHSLSAEVLNELAESDFLMPLFMVVASVSSMHRLIDIKNAQIDPEQGDAG